MISQPYLTHSLTHTSRIVSAVGARRYTTKFKGIPHQFSIEEAAKIFAEHDATRIFSPDELSKGDYPIKKVYLPMHSCDALVSKTDYVGKYGIPHTEFVSTGKNVVVYTYMVWYDTQGALGEKSYSDLRAYAGYEMDAEDVETAFQDYEVIEQLESLEIQEDELLMCESMASEVFKNCIYGHERSRAVNDITERHGSSITDIKKLESLYSSKLISYYLPAYIEQREGQPIRILPALNPNRAKVQGKNPVSASKAAALAFVISVAISVAMPQLAIPGRVACAVFGPAVTAFYTKRRLGMIQQFKESKIQEKKQANLALIEQEKPLQIEAPVIKVTKSVLKHARTLGLSEDQPLSEEVINAAYEASMRLRQATNKEMVAHTQDSIQAQKVLLEYLKRTRE